MEGESTWCQLAKPQFTEGFVLTVSPLVPGVKLTHSQFAGVWHDTPDVCIAAADPPAVEITVSKV